MSNENMKQRFLEVTAEYGRLSAEEMTPEMRFLEDLGFSSFDFMAYLGDLEEKFDVEVDESEAFKIRTLGDAMDYIDKICA